MKTPGPWSRGFRVCAIFSFHFHAPHVTMWAAGDPRGCPVSLLTSGGIAMRGIRFVVAGALLVAGMVAVIWAQPGGGGIGASPAFLVQNKAVQEDLKATEE